MRLFFIIISGFWKRPIRFSDRALLRIPVLPNDIDVRIMTNDRYFAFMDLGRIDFMQRLGVLKKIFAKNWVPIVLTQFIQYKAPISVFQQVELHTKVLWWDEYDFWIEQVFMRKNKLLAIGYVQASWYRKGVRIPSSQFFQLIPAEYSLSDPPENLKSILQLGQEIRTNARRLKKSGTFATSK
ncbi:acyl-CoA thioesterase [Leptospira perolatii]|uniref:acyl-CoA thioesterase n=1 Tax=Leptospira perolatii TaxID=2023191 RepID=UPI0013FDBB77|nr:acyl-CoA thioesterase [Leptospira perolatii]